MVKIEFEETSGGKPFLSVQVWENIAQGAAAMEVPVVEGGKTKTKFGEKYYLDVLLNTEAGEQEFRLLLNKTSLKNIKQSGIEDTDEISHVRIEKIKTLVRGKMMDILVVTKAYKRRGGKK